MRRKRTERRAVGIDAMLEPRVSGARCRPSSHLSLEPPVESAGPARSKLHGLGLRVYGASRSIAEQPYETLRLDVDDDASVRAAVGEVIEREGRVDILVNCAGYVLAGAVEETSIDEARAQMETNFFGAVRTLQAVLPEMRRQRSGLIINIGSIAGLIPMPFQAFYSASKSALTTVSEALAMEVAGLGIRIINIQPGDFRTAITANRRRAKSMGLEEDYRLRGERAVIDNGEG